VEDLEDVKAAWEELDKAQEQLERANEKLGAGLLYKSNSTHRGA
jgi:hypothetical protein